MSKRALVVEDDANIAELLRLYLSKDGFDVMIASDGNKAEADFDLFQPDVVMLDIMLPGKDGWEVCRSIRKKSTTPIIMLTAKGETNDKVTGLEMGADDYVTKPFNPVEVQARVRSQLRRYMMLGGGKRSEDVLGFGGLELNDRSKEVTVDGEPATLTPKEYEILKLLMQNPGKVFSPAEIYEQVWKDSPLGAENTVAVHIRHLREKIEIDPANPRYIKVVWGHGYRMEEQKR